MKKFLLMIFCAAIICNFFLCINADANFNKKNFADTSKDNSLTKKEKQEGWKLLFDGENLKGWHFYQNKKSDCWNVENNAIHTKGKDTKKHADLMSDGEFQNFELSVDWKVSPQANSGILYLVSEKYDQSYLSGPEYQIIDDKGYPEKIEDWQKSGANYAMNAPSEDATKPVGEWNRTTIIVNNGHVEHWLNGKKVVDYDLWSDEWKKNKAAEKWKDVASYGASKIGHIALQESHSGNPGEIWFKNIKIKTL
ncbi:MAG: 3-keto-disaccharide hydrolase [Chitinophagaceae bacterium]